MDPLTLFVFEEPLTKPPQGAASSDGWWSEPPGTPNELHVEQISRPALREVRCADGVWLVREPGDKAPS